MSKLFKSILGLAVLSLFTLQIQSCGGDDEEPPVTDDGSAGNCPDPAKLTPPTIKDVVEGKNAIYVHCTGMTGEFFQVQATPEPMQAQHFDLKPITINSVKTPIKVRGLVDGMLYNIKVKAVINCDGSHFSDWTDAPEYKLCADSPAWSTLNRAALLLEVNEARSVSRACDGSNISDPVHPLKWNYQLEEAADIHNDDMVENNFFSHTSETDGSSPQDRTGRTGYGTRTGENIAKGRPQSDIIEQWLNSPGHCLNIMNPNWVDMGIAGDTKATVYTQVFGRK